MKTSEILHNKITDSLAYALKQSRIKWEDALAYMIFFDALWDDEVLIRWAIKRLKEKDWLFEEILNEIEKAESEKGDSKNAQKILDFINNK